MEKQTFWETLLQQSANPIIAATPDGTIQLCNNAAAEIFQLHDSIGQSLETVFPYVEVTSLFANGNSGKNSAEIMLTHDSRVFTVQVSAVAGAGSILIFQDVTHLREINRIKSEFVNTLSRDLRSPLTAILGYVELLERIGPLSEQQKGFIGRIIFSVQSITALITNLLDLDRIEAGLERDREFVHMRQIVNYSVEGLRSRIDEKSQHLEVIAENDLPLLIGNAIRLRQLVNHLLENAIEYTKPQGYIRINLFSEDEFLLLAISDTGVGISPEEQGYIFEKFYRGSNSISMANGSGLGLSIVKTIVEQHDGRIWVESQVGVGSTFTVMLPCYNEISSRLEA